MDPSLSEETSPGLATLREQFPVLTDWAYMNAGTDGPLPATAPAAAAEELDRQTFKGRTAEHFERRQELESQLRAAYAARLGCVPEEVALTTCTSEGMSIVVGGMELGPGDEILTSDSEHPGLLGALQAARDLSGVQVRLEPLDALPERVAPNTKLVACSHVSWVSGCMAPVALAGLRDHVTILLDGAQGVGAVPTDVHALGCHAYAGPGQKWLCGPDGLGMLYVSAELTELGGHIGYTVRSLGSTALRVSVSGHGVIPASAPAGQVVGLKLNSLGRMLSPSVALVTKTCSGFCSKMPSGWSRCDRPLEVPIQMEPSESSRNASSFKSFQTRPSFLVRWRQRAPLKT